MISGIVTLVVCIVSVVDCAYGIYIQCRGVGNPHMLSVMQCRIVPSLGDDN